MPWNPFGKKRDEFEELFREACRRLKVEVVKWTSLIAVVKVRGETVDVNLANLRARTALQEAQAQATYLESSLGILFKGPTPETKDVTGAHERVLPRLLASEFAQGERLPSRPFIQGIVDVGLMVDEGQRGFFVDDERLRMWNEKFDPLYSRAIENLRKRSPPDIWKSFPQLPGLLCYGDPPDAYGSSRALILRELLDPWPPAGVVTWLPARDFLMCIRIDNASSLSLVPRGAAFAKSVHDAEGYQITDRPLWFDGERWEPATLEGIGGRLGMRPGPRFRERIRELGFVP